MSKRWRVGELKRQPAGSGHTSMFRAEILGRHFTDRNNVIFNISDAHWKLATVQILFITTEFRSLA